MEYKTIFALLGSVATSIFGFTYGETVTAMYVMLTLATFIFLDWLSGSRAAKKDETYRSKYGIDGVFRSFFMLILPAGGHFLDMVFNLPPVFFGLLAGGLIYHTIQSATANALRAGWGEWIPEWVLNKIAEWVKSEIESKAKRSLERKIDFGTNKTKKKDDL